MAAIKFEWLWVAANGCEWLLVATFCCNWLRWLRVDSSGCEWLKKMQLEALCELPSNAVGCGWLRSAAIGIDWVRVAANDCELLRMTQLTRLAQSMGIYAAKSAIVPFCGRPRAMAMAYRFDFRL